MLLQDLYEAPAKLVDQQINSKKHLCSGPVERYKKGLEKLLQPSIIPHQPLTLFSLIFVSVSFMETRSVQGRVQLVALLPSRIKPCALDRAFGAFVKGGTARAEGLVVPCLSPHGRP